MIEFDLDDYGKLARFSNIADMLELAVLRGTKVARGKVADWLGDIGVDPQKDLLAEEELLDQTEVTNLVFDVLAERQGVLGPHYPFVLSDNSLSLKDDKPDPPVYESLLALTIAHAHKVDTEAAPTNLFEDVVVQALQGRGWLAVRVGEGRTRFEVTLRGAGEAVGLSVDPGAAVHSRAANDEGVDVLAHYHLYEDSRDTRLILIGQATLEKSHGWEKKATEVKAKRWKNYLRTQLPPVQFFAVPHHIESREFTKLVEGIDILVLDRLRLVLMLDFLSQPSEAVWQAVMNEGMELWA